FNHVSSSVLVTFNTDIYTLSLLVALPFSPPRPLVPAVLVARPGRAPALPRRLDQRRAPRGARRRGPRGSRRRRDRRGAPLGGLRSEEHTTELQSRDNIVCRLLLDKRN